MKKLLVNIALAAALCALSVGTASAKVKSGSLTFGSDFWVGETLVKKGTYKVAYDDKTGEVSILDKENTLARASARAEKRERSHAGWDVKLAPKGDRVTLVSLAFPGDKQNLLLGDAAAQSDAAK